MDQATEYASQHNWCLSQARINWEGCVRKGILHKNGGDGRGGALISLDGVAPLHSTPLTGRAVKPQRQGHIGGPIAQP